MRCRSCGFENTNSSVSCELCNRSLTTTGTCDPDDALIDAVRSETLAVLNPTPAVSVPASTSVSQAVRLIAEKNIGCVLVVDNGELLGIFSERDVLTRIGTRYEQVANEPISKFMTTKPVTLTVEDSIAFALNRMDIHDFRHIPVKQPDGRLSVISVRDVLAYIARHFPELQLQQN